MPALVITSTRSGAETGRLLAALAPDLTHGDRLYLETSVTDPRSLLVDDLAAPVITADDLAPFDPKHTGVTIVGLASVAAGGWRRLARWAEHWHVVVVHEGEHDMLRWAADEVPGLTWIEQGDVSAAIPTLKSLLRSV